MTESVSETQPTCDEPQAGGLGLSFDDVVAKYTVLRPHANAQAHSAFMEWAKTATKKEFLQSLVAAGIYTPDGRLTSWYAGDTDGWRASLPPSHPDWQPMPPIDANLLKIARSKVGSWSELKARRFSPERLAELNKEVEAEVRRIEGEQVHTVIVDELADMSDARGREAELSDESMRMLDAGLTSGKTEQAIDLGTFAEYLVDDSVDDESAK